jgi:hypothetical protein
VRGLLRTQRLFPYAEITTALGVDEQVTEALWISVKLKIMYENTNCIMQIFVLLAYGGSSFEKALN